MAIGLVRYLRKIGYGPLPILAYKTVLTLDAPLQLVGKMVQAAWRGCIWRASGGQAQLAGGAWRVPFLDAGIGGVLGCVNVKSEA